MVKGVREADCRLPTALNNMIIHLIMRGAKPGDIFKDTGEIGKTFEAGFRGDFSEWEYTNS